MWLYIFIIISLMLFLGYGALILIYRFWFIQMKPYEVAVPVIPSNTFSVIIPARNEENNIGKCIDSILSQDYPSSHFEIIVIDDYSQDATADIVKGYAQKHPNVFLLDLEKLLQGKRINAYKKKSIELAIATAKHDWIVTTDADCIAYPAWLSSFSSYIDHNKSVLVAAPVVFTNDGSLLQSFQCIDFMTMQGVTAAAVSAGFHSMCNGANLAYQKEAFNSVGGFAGIDHIASGDDMLLMHKIKAKYPGRVGYLFCQQSIIRTAPAQSWREFINQRVRWASKAVAYDDKSLFWVLFLMYFFNVSLFILPWMGLFFPILLLGWFILLTLKTLVEISFAKPMSKFFGIELKPWFILLQYHHITYMVVAGWLGKFGTYQWKGRKVQ